MRTISFFVGTPAFSVFSVVLREYWTNFAPI